MSNIKLSKLLATAGNNWLIDIDSDSYLYRAGMVLQTVYVRTDSQATFSSATSGDGTTITPLEISITPKRSDSLLVFTWMLNGEIGENNVFLIHKDGSLITTSGYESYNNVVGNLRYSGLVSTAYDNDQSTTMSNYFIRYFIPSSSTTAATYAPAIRSAGPAAQTFYLNRSMASAGQNGVEIAVSSGMVQEIAQ